MVYTKKAKRRFNRKRKAIKRRYNRRRNARHGNQLVWKPSYHNPVPTEYLTKFRCKGQGYLTIAGANPVGFFNGSSWHFDNLTLNNLYQPLAPLQTAGINQIDGLNWATSSFLQPIGMLTLCNSTLYKNYQVLATKVKFTMMPSALSDRVDVVMQPLAVGSGASAPITISSAIAEPYAKTGYFCPGEKTKPLSMYIDIARFAGIDKKVFRNDYVAWSGTYNSSPTNQIGLALLAQTTDHNSIGIQMGFIIEFEYYVRLYNVEANILL